MSFGLANIGFTNNAAPAGAPSPINDLNNGLSIDALLNGVLGQNVGEAGNPAQLLNNREIPLSGFSIDFLGTGIDILLDDLLNVFKVANGAIIGARIDLANNIYDIGDFDGVNQGMGLRVWDAVGQRRVNMGDVGFINNGMAFSIYDDLQQVLIEGSTAANYGLFLKVDSNNQDYEFGDVDSVGFFAGNNTKLKIDDANRIASIEFGFGNQFLYLDPLAGVYWQGDIPGIFDNTYSYFDNTGDYNLVMNGNQAINFHAANDRYRIGDIDDANTGIELNINGVLNTIELDNLAHNLKIVMNGAAGFTGTVAGVTNITVNGGIVTAAS